MEFLEIGDKINIQRSDGCVQTATVGLKSLERQVVTVEWMQGNKVKGKEIPWAAVLQLNPFLGKPERKLSEKVLQPQQQQPQQPQPPPPPPPQQQQQSKGDKRNNSLSMYCKKANNSPYMKRIRAGSHGDSNSSSPTIKPTRPPSQGMIAANMRKMQQMSAAAHGASTMPSNKRYSSVVREVERLKQERERRRAVQAEQRREQTALKSKDPDNPNWEVALMVSNYREQLVFNPLRSLRPGGARAQQITVCVRKRPMSQGELQRKALDVISVPTHNSLIVHELRNKVDLTKLLEHHKFRFDYTFDEQCSNTLVYEHTAKPLIRTMFEGGNATCFAYGQTGSGKTHTMGGEFCGKVQDCTTGIYALAARDVFAELAKPKYRDMGVSITCSYFEIYGTKVFDLLLPEKPLLRVLEDGRQQVVIVGLTKMPVSKVEDVLALIEQGNRERTSGQTSVNIKSSRSHAVFQMGLLLPNQWEPSGKCSFVDLAGNERGADTQSANRQTRREGADINKSLLALKECIRALSRHSSHLPFRGSKLTQVLRDSFVGGEQNKTCMIAMISPCLSSVENTLNTLRYADRLKELVAKKDDLVESDYDQPLKINDQAEDDLRRLRQFCSETDTESDDFEGNLTDEPGGFDDFITGQASSFLPKSDSTQDTSEAYGDGDTADGGTGDGDGDGSGYAEMESEIVVQHEILFEFFRNYKMGFDEAVNGSTALNKSERLAKFLLDMKPALGEIEVLMKNLYSLINTYNSERFSECEMAHSDDAHEL